MVLMGVRTTIGRENVVMSELEDKVNSQDLNISAVLHPEKLQGYIIIEGGEDDIRDVVNDLRHVNGLIDKPVGIDEVSQFLEAKKTSIELNRGDIVEIIGGPFKHEKGKITNVDEGDQEVTAELLEAAVPMPVTISADSVRVLEQAQDKTGKTDEEEE